MWSVLGIIAAPLVKFILYIVDSAIKRKATYKSNVDEFQDIEQTSLSDEQECIAMLNK